MNPFTPVTLSAAAATYLNGLVSKIQADIAALELPANPSLSTANWTIDNTGVGQFVQIAIDASDVVTLTTTPFAHISWASYVTAGVIDEAKLTALGLIPQITFSPGSSTTFFRCQSVFGGTNYANALVQFQGAATVAYANPSDATIGTTAAGSTVIEGNPYSYVSNGEPTFLLPTGVTATNVQTFSVTAGEWAVSVEDAYHYFNTTSGNPGAVFFYSTSIDPAAVVTTVQNYAG